MSKMDDLISKSLDDIDTMVEEFSKGIGDEDLAPNDVSEEAPQADDGTEAPQGDEQPDTDEGAGDDADVDNDAEAEQNEQEDEEVEKSLEEELKGNESIRKALEVSEFLDALVKGISDRLTQHGDVVSKSLGSADTTQEYLAKSFSGLAKSQRLVLEAQQGLSKSIKALNKRLTELESTPVVRKSVASAPAAQVLEKSFNGTPANQAPTLTKSQISNKLFKGLQENQVSQEDLLAFESLGNLQALSPSAQDYVNGSK